VAAALSERVSLAGVAAKGRLAAGAWAEHPSLVAVRDRLQRSPTTAGNLRSHRKAPAAAGVYLHQGYKEPSLSYGSAIEAARSEPAFFAMPCALAGMLSFLHPAPCEQLLRVLVMSNATHDCRCPVVADMLVLAMAAWSC